MKRHKNDAWPGDLAEPIRLALAQPWGVISGVVEKVLIIGELEVRKLHHDFTDLLTRPVQPARWLRWFGEVFARPPAMPTGDLPSIDFMTPGMLAQSVLFIAIFSGIAIIWERD